MYVNKYADAIELDQLKPIHSFFHSSDIHLEQITRMK